MFGGGRGGRKFPAVLWGKSGLRKGKRWLYNEGEVEETRGGRFFDFLRGILIQQSRRAD